MTEDTKKVLQERKQLFEDLFDGIVPKRVPINAHMPIELPIQYAGLPLAQTQWTLAGMEEAMEKALEVTRSDYYPYSYPRYPAHSEILGTKGSKMGSNGFIQRPEVKRMDAEEYDEFIHSPYDFIWEKILPRVNTELDTDPITRTIRIIKAVQSQSDYAQKYQAIEVKLIEKYGYYTLAPGTAGASIAPFDFIANNVRSFSGINLDVRRNPEKLMAACEAVLPLSIKRGLPPVPSKYGQTFIPLHLASYLRTSDFEKLYWPTLAKLIHTLAEAGQPSFLFCENDWMRYLDHLLDLPDNTRLWFEYGNAQLVKDKLGKKHILSGFYPITYLKSATKMQCIDKVKELIDIMAPGGKYYFEFDKGPLSLDTINVENYRAVLEYVAENTTYTNAGESVNPQVQQKQGERIVEIPQIKSKYYRTWPAYKAEHPNMNPSLEPVMAPKLQSYEDMVFNLVFRML